MVGGFRRPTGDGQSVQAVYASVFWSWGEPLVLR